MSLIHNKNKNGGGSGTSSRALYAEPMERLAFDIKKSEDILGKA